VWRKKREKRKVSDASEIYGNLALKRRKGGKGGCEEKFGHESGKGKRGHTQ